MAACFCCDSIQPYRNQRLDHEPKFTSFMEWASGSGPSASGDTQSSHDLNEMDPPFAVQLVRQVNFGPLESKRYFVPVSKDLEAFVEITEDDLIAANFQKLNSYKNFKCAAHNKFFEVNLYKRDPVNKHHWRANLARPASSIDL